MDRQPAATLDNPYLPPREQPAHKVEQRTANPVRNVLLDIIRTLVTIAGITAGWVIMAMTSANWGYGALLVGCGIILSSALLGLGLGISYPHRRAGDDARRTIVS